MKMLCLAREEEKEGRKAIERMEWNERPNNNNESTNGAAAGFENAPRTKKNAVALEFLTILVWVPSERLRL